MRLIKLYRKLVEFRTEYLRRIELHDSLWIYCHSDIDGQIVRQIFQIEKQLKQIIKIDN